MALRLCLHLTRSGSAALKDDVAIVKSLFAFDFVPLEIVCDNYLTNAC